MLALGRPVPGQAGNPGCPGDRVRCGFAFGAILLKRVGTAAVLAAATVRLRVEMLGKVVV